MQSEVLKSQNLHLLLDLTLSKTTIIGVFLEDLKFSTLILSNSLFFNFLIYYICIRKINRFKLAKTKAKKETPLMTQYNGIKAKHPDALLLFRVGDFYETFGEDYKSL